MRLGSGRGGWWGSVKDITQLMRTAGLSCQECRLWSESALTSSLGHSILCDLAQTPQLVYASVSPSVKWE